MPQIVAPHIKFPDWRPFFKCRRKCNKRQLKAKPKNYKNYGKAKGGGKWWGENSMARKNAENEMTLKVSQ